MRLAQRFADKFFVEANSGCWLWTASIVTSGYGAFNLCGRSRTAHKVAWELFRGPIPKGLQVLHHCDVPSCVNPAHLFLGTNADNRADSVAKGRGAILQKGQVQEIRTRSEAEEPQRAIAADYGINQSTVSRIVTRKIWA